MSGGNLTAVYHFYTMAVIAATIYIYIRTSVSKTHARVSVLRMKFKS